MVYSATDSHHGRLALPEAQRNAVTGSLTTPQEHLLQQNFVPCKSVGAAVVIVT